MNNRCDSQNQTKRSLRANLLLIQTPPASPEGAWPNFTLLFCPEGLHPQPRGCRGKREKKEQLLKKKKVPLHPRRLRACRNPLKALFFRSCAAPREKNDAPLSNFNKGASGLQKKSTKFNQVNAYTSPVGRQSTVGKGGVKSNGKNRGLKRVLSLSQILGRQRQKRQKKGEQLKHLTPLKPIIPPKSLIMIFKNKPAKAIYNQRIINYKNTNLLHRYIGLGGKILPRSQTRLTAKQQRYVAKTIKSARIMGLLPFVSKVSAYYK